MRIVGLVDNNVYPAMFGLTVRVWNLYRGLAKNPRVEAVRVVCALKSRERAVARETRDGVEVVRLKPWHPTIFAWLERTGVAPLFLAAEAYRRWPWPFARAMDRAADVVQIDSLNLVPLWRVAPPGALRVFGSQNVEAEWFERVGPGLARREMWARRLARLEREALETADLVLAVSRPDREQFVARYGIPAARVEVIENGFDAERIRPPTPDEKRGARAALGLGDEERGLLFLGSDFEHNRRAAEDLFRVLVPELAGFRARLYLVGDVAVRFRGRAETEGGGRVRAVPAQADLTPYLWGCDVGLNPITTGAGSNIKLPTYLAAGLEALSTPFGVRGFERLAPFVVQAELETFGDALARALVPPAPVDPGARAAVLASYSWQAQADRLAGFFAERLAARGPG